MANFTDPYWTPPIQFQKVVFQKPITNTLGFQHDIMWPLPVSIGSQYFGVGASPYGPKELVYSSQGEYFARGGNVIPSTGGKSMINVYAPEYAFRRADYTVKK